MNKKIIVGVVILAVVVVGGMYLTKDTVVVNNPDQLGAVSSPDIQSPWTCHAGICTWSSKGSFLDATTTIVSMANPTGATSTVDYMSLVSTGVATATLSTIACGTSTTAYAAPTASIISSGSIATSTMFNAITNNVGSQYGTASGGSVARIEVKPAEFLLCTASSVYTGALTEVTNTFAGNYFVRWLWNR